MEGDDSSILDTELTKIGLTREYSVGEIVLIKVKNDDHHWPGKITHINLYDESAKKTL